MIPPSAARYLRHLPAMSIKTTLHATAPLLYPCRGYPKCPWGLYASPPPVPMAVVGWFLCFPAFFLGKWVFFPIRDLRQKKKFTRVIPKKNNNFPSNKKRNLGQKKKVMRLTPKIKNKKATYAHLHNRVTLSPFQGDLLCSNCRSEHTPWHLQGLRRSNILQMLKLHGYEECFSGCRWRHIYFTSIFCGTHTCALFGV